MREGLFDCRAVLRAAGLADEATSRAAVLSDVSRSHCVTRADLPDGRAYVVKQVSATARSAGRSLRAELFAYRLAGSRDRLAASVPRVVHLDERHGVVALQAAAPEQLYPHQLQDPAFPSPVLAAELGRALRRLHDDTAGQPLLTVAACGVLQLPDTHERDWQLGDGSVAAWSVARVAAADPVLAPVLREAAAALAPSCLVHGDVKWDNAVLDAGPPVRVQLFDWELSGLGDPAWDLGSALADTAGLPVRLGGRQGAPREASAWLGSACRALLQGYAAAGAVPDPFLGQVVRCWVGRTVHLALECAGAGPDGPAAGDLLEAARGLAGVRGEVTASIRRLLGG